VLQLRFSSTEFVYWGLTLAGLPGIAAMQVRAAGGARWRGRFLC
jgi:hypothetical protein